MSKFKLAITSLAIGLLVSTGLAHAACQKSDVMVYGGTPGGISAALQAARLGKRVILVEPTGHIGGMMASGLNRTDVSPRKGVYGGIVLEFLEKARTHYQTSDPIRVYFESKWAERTFEAMLRKDGVTVVKNAPLTKARVQDHYIRAFSTANGQLFCSSVYVDASYEGDLLAKAGVTFFLGREDKGTYGESLAGVQPLEPIKLPNGKVVPVDPYVVPGDPNSGLLPGLAAPNEFPIGSVDRSIMAYNYRVCVTNDPAKRTPFSQPAGYDPKRYELIARFFAGIKKVGGGLSPNYFVGSSETVVRKFDVNSSRYFSTDVFHIGYDYITSNPETRSKILDEIKLYTQGFFWFGQTDPRVPEAIRAHTARFGYCKDEFTDNGNFPRQLYVREGRRMVGDFVLRESDLMSKPDFLDSIGLGYYPSDEHGMRRTVKDGNVVQESRHSVGVRPYEIPYRALHPKASEVRNLLVPVALSASHVAFTSVRVEPTFMVLGQAAGAAAALAPKGDVNAVNVAQLRQVLQQAGQIIDLKRR